MSTITPQSVSPTPVSGFAGKRKRRICHVSMCLTTGGLERLLVEFARRTNRDEYDLLFVALGETGQPAREIEELGHRVISLHQTKTRRWQQFAQLRKFFRTEEVDLVHSHNTYAHFYSAFAARAAGVPVVINTQHGRGTGTHWKQRAHFAIANRFADRILAVSEDSARICRKQDSISKKKIEPLWNGIDLDRFTYHGPVASPHAISVARLSPEKDFPTLIKAVRIVADKYPAFRLSIVGDGVERMSLEQLTHELDLDCVITFLGERNDIPELLKESAMFLSSSSTEGISLTLLEAMAVGLPIITTDVGGNPEIVDQEATGYLVPARHPQELAGQIIQHLQQPDTWQPMGTLARHRVEQQFHIDRMIRDYENLYRSLLIESRA